MKNIHNEITQKFYEAILTLQSTDECAILFEDICTVKELKDIASRLEIAKMLNAGRSYTEISAATGASSATIGRVNRCLGYGSGGYEMILDRVGENKKTDEDD